MSAAGAQNICGIPLPRAADTCTRCPTEVRLSQLPPSNGLLWEATVKLRREHSLGAASRALFHQGSSNCSSNSMYSPMSAGRPPSHTGSSAANSNSGSKAGGSSLYPSVAPPGSPVPSSAPLQQQPSQGQLSNDQAHQHEVPPMGADSSTSLETVFRAGIARPEDLPAAVSAAQACLLAGFRGPAAADYSKRNALHTATSFGHHQHGSAAAGDAAGMALRTAEAGQHAGLKFSRDVVIVEVSGAPVDLTLIDLPGGGRGGLRAAVACTSSSQQHASWLIRHRSLPSPCQLQLVHLAKPAAGCSWQQLCTACTQFLPAPGLLHLVMPLFTCSPPTPMPSCTHTHTLLHPHPHPPAHPHTHTHAQASSTMLSALRTSTTRRWSLTWRSATCGVRVWSSWPPSPAQQTLTHR